MAQHKIRILLGGELANLYELGWISADLSQLVEFSQLLEGEKSERAERFFGEKARPFNRFANISDIRERRPEIVEVKKGSIELTLAGVGIAAAIIMPLVQVAVQRRLTAANEAVHFEVSPQDQTLKQMLDDYQSGQLGHGTDGLGTLFYLLERRTYDVRVLAENVYLINHTIERYSQRIVRTIRKNM
jgi:hypothetical protein